MSKNAHCRLLPLEQDEFNSMESTLMFEPLLGEREVAHGLAVSLATIRRWRLTGGGPRYLKIGSSVRYRQSEIKAFLESRPIGGGVKPEVALGR